MFIVSIVPNVVIGEALHHEWHSSDRSPALQVPIHGKCFGDGILAHDTRLRTYSAIDDEPKGRYRETYRLFLCVATRCKCGEISLNHFLEETAIAVCLLLHRGGVGQAWEEV